MSRSTPSLVLFDLDGVLVDYDRGVRVRHLATALDVDATVVHDALFDSGLEDRFDAGLVAADDYLAMLGEALGRFVDRRTWIAARKAAMRMDPAVPRLLQDLAGRCDIALLTNNGELLIEALPSIAPELASAFADRALCSGALRRRKPDPAAFLDAVGLLGHCAGDTLFLDDAVANVEGARRAGLRAEQVRGASALTAVLAAYGLA